MVQVLSQGPPPPGSPLIVCGVYARRLDFEDAFIGRGSLACTLGESPTISSVFSSFALITATASADFALVSHFSTPPVVVVTPCTSWLEPIQKHENRSII